MRNTCFFNNHTNDVLYQLCSCGRHAWSMRAQRSITIHEDGYFLFSNKNGKRYKYFCIKKKSMILWMFEVFVKIAIIAFVFYFSYGLWWLDPPSVATV